MIYLSQREDFEICFKENIFLAVFYFSYYYSLTSKNLIITSNKSKRERKSFRKIWQDPVKMLDRSRAMIFIRMLKNGNDVIFDLPRPIEQRRKEEKIFHRGFVNLVFIASFDRERRTKRGREGRREGKTFLGRRFLASAFRGSTVQKILSRVSLFFP